MTSTMLRPRVERGVRDATAADNDALVALARMCPMRGDITMCVDRAPDFFALVRLEGERWRVGIAESDGAVVGCVAASERLAYVNGATTPTAYLGDLKVHPAHRGGFAADALVEFTREAVRGYGGEDMLALVTVLQGNRAMERRAVGPRGLPALARFATLDVHAIPLLWPRADKVAGLRVAAAREADLDEMGALWNRVAPGRQLAPVLGPARLQAWIANAPVRVASVASATSAFATRRERVRLCWLTCDTRFPLCGCES